ncbi:MAG: response regulator [Planctomycetes bacterium]|nr:response regulator [Planctomycetota bacterium]
MSKILLVEDDPMNVDMLSRRLVKRGYEVVVAVDGLQAVALGKSESPDLILMDLGIPLIDGWEATRQLKADPASAAIPIIALTARAMPEELQSAREAGCEDCDTKPIDLKRLLGKMQALLNEEPTP